MLGLDPYSSFKHMDPKKRAGSKANNNLYLTSGIYIMPNTMVRGEGNGQMEKKIKIRS